MGKANRVRRAVEAKKWAVKVVEEAVHAIVFARREKSLVPENDADDQSVKAKLLWSARKAAAIAADKATNAAKAIAGAALAKKDIDDPSRMINPGELETPAGFAATSSRIPAAVVGAGILPSEVSGVQGHAMGITQINQVANSAPTSNRANDSSSILTLPAPAAVLTPHKRHNPDLPQTCTIPVPYGRNVVARIGSITQKRATSTVQDASKYYGSGRCDTSNEGGRKI